MPIHAGHVFLCETALEMVDQLTVLVCSNDTEEIDGDLRLQWVKACVPNARVVHMHRDIPQEPSEHPDFWSIWKQVLKEHHPEPIDYVFGSESYIHKLALTVDSKAVLVDPNRDIFSVGASAIRKNPAENWKYVPPPVRAHFQKRVCLLGPESSGKSTMASMLGKQFNATVMPEYGRTYDVEYRQGLNWTSSDFRQLAKTHIAMRNAISTRATQLIIEDTDVIQTALWADYLLNDNWETSAQLLANGSFADHYLLLSPEMAWINDGSRYSGDERTRRWFFEVAIQVLVKNNCRAPRFIDHLRP